MRWRVLPLAVPIDPYGFYSRYITEKRQSTIALCRVYWSIPISVDDASSVKRQSTAVPLFAVFITLIDSSGVDFQSHTAGNECSICHSYISRTDNFHNQVALLRWNADRGSISAIFLQICVDDWRCTCETAVDNPSCAVFHWFRKQETGYANIDTLSACRCENLRFEKSVVDSSGLVFAEPACTESYVVFRPYIISVYKNVTIMDLLYNFYRSLPESGIYCVSEASVEDPPFLRFSTFSNSSEVN